MTTTSPQVSVLVPTLDVSESVRDAVEAVLKQTFSDLELLVLDGGSTDGTLEILDSFDDGRMRVYTDCGSITESLNKGVDEASGTYIARTDADTVPDATWLEQCIDFLEEHPDHAAVGAQVKRIMPDGTVVVTDKPLEHEDIVQTLVRQNALVHPSMVIRTAMLEAVGRYRDRHWEDYDLVVRLAAEYRLANLPEVLVIDHRREDSIVGSTPISVGLLASLRCNVLALRRLDLPLPVKMALGVKQVFISLRWAGYKLYHRHLA